ncbi:MAG: flagellar motor switch protein FliG [Fimbriimonas ginsengisoli]|uniref:Flagellar motor switch protein FliG n=1 Tax=Fimbriimonas ginsengisoli TaxID=1005039 RepID=A0A931PU15_FIMGI|nr:flagellar motor switch protein FliG [Fimbriimonas ginsengisoli]
MRKRPEDLSSRQRAAVVLMVLGPEVAGRVIRNFNEEQTEQITLELARLDKITPEQRENIIQEFYEVALAQDFIAEGGVEHARRLLEEAYGGDAAKDMIGKVVAAMQVVPFDFLRKADPAQVQSFIQDEHPQTIALILAYMPMNSAAQILSKLPTELRADVAARIAMMEQTPPEVIRRVEQVLEKKVSSILNQEMTQAGGPKTLVDLLNRVDRSTERLILETLTENNPELAEVVKNMMFVFEDIIQLDDKAIQSVLREVDIKDLATALKGTNPEVQEKIFKNMSERAVGMLKEDMEFMGPVRLRVVEEAQQRFVAVIRRLEESGELTIGRTDEEDVLV